MGYTKMSFALCSIRCKDTKKGTYTQAYAKKVLFFQKKFGHLKKKLYLCTLKAWNALCLVM